MGVRTCLLALAAAAALAAGPAAAQQDALPADLRAAADAYDQAQIHSDRAELERLLADDYLLRNSGGKVQDKASFIADSVAPGFHLEPYTLEERVERVYGDTAVMAAVANLKGTDGGKPFSVRLRAVDIWAKRDGRWRVIFTEATRLPPT